VQDPLEKYSWRVFGAIRAVEAAGQLNECEWLEVAELVYLIAVYQCLRKVIPQPD
jgi:hypothetical protein